MQIKDNSDLIGYGIGAVLAAAFIYYCWRWLVGALAIFGLVFLWSTFTRNRRLPPF